MNLDNANPSVEVINKALFIPLFKEYYQKVVALEQDCEIKPNNYRGWSVKNVYPGRKAVFSNGYGKANRAEFTVVKVSVTGDLVDEGIPQWHIDAVESIYGNDNQWLVAYVKKATS